MRPSILRKLAIATVCLCALLFGALALRAIGVVRAAGNNSIVGTVSAADSGQPLAGMEVTLWEPSAGSWAYASISKWTADDGTYSFPDLADGAYTLRFESGSSYLGEFWIDKPDTESADSIHLSDGNSFTADADLTRGGSISGVVIDHKTGTLMHSVSVKYFRQVSLPGEPVAWSEIGSVPTANDGTFTFPSLPHGVYTLEFSAPGTGEYAIQYYNNKPTLESANEINVGAEPVVDINAALVAYAGISGTVRDAAGTPVAGIYACALPADAPPPVGVPRGDGCLVKNIESNSDGAYSIGDLAAGDYTIHFFDTDFPQRYLDFWYDNAFDASNRTVITLAESEKQPGIDVQMTETLAVYGTVLDPAATPVAGMQVRLYEEHNNKWNWHHTTTTNAYGEYEFQLLQPITVSVALIDPRGIYMPKYTANATSLEGADIRPVLTKTLPYNATAPLAVGGALTGTVVDEQATPLAGIEVHAWLAAGTERNAEWLRATTTDDFGTFGFSGTGEEPLLLAVRDPNGIYQDAWYADTISATTAGNATPVLVMPGTPYALTPITMTLATAATPPQSGKTWGTVVDSSGQPIAGALVHLYWLPGWRARVHDRDVEALTCPASGSAPQPLTSGMLVNASAETIAPAANPILADALGRFGWDLAPGCWYVHASAAGHYDNTSPLYGIRSRADTEPSFVVELASLPATPTSTYTPTPIYTPTDTATNTPTGMPISTQTNTPENTATGMPTGTNTPVPPPTATGIHPATVTAAQTPAFTKVPAQSTPSTSVTPTPMPSSEPPATPQATTVPTATPRQPVVPQPARELVDFSGTVYEDVNRNRVKEVGEAGIANVVLELEEITQAASAPVTLQAETRRAVSSITGGYQFEKVPVGDYLLRMEVPSGFKQITPDTILLKITGAGTPRLYVPLGVERATTIVLLPVIQK